MKPLTVGALRQAIAGLPDEAGVYPRFTEEPTMEGSISYEGTELGKDDQGRDCLLFLIEEHLWEDDEDDICDECDEAMPEGNGGGIGPHHDPSCSKWAKYSDEDYEDLRRNNALERN